MYSYKIDKTDYKKVGPHTVYRLISPYGKKSGYGTSPLVVEPANNLMDLKKDSLSADTLSFIGEDVVLINCRVSGSSIVGDTVIEDSEIKCSRVRDAKIESSSINFSQVTFSNVSSCTFDFLVVGGSSMSSVDAKIALDQKQRKRFVSNCNIEKSSLKGFFDITESDISNCFFGLSNGGWGYYSGKDFSVSNAEIKSSTDIFLNSIYCVDFCYKTIYSYKSKNGDWLFCINGHFSKDPFEEMCKTENVFEFQRYSGKAFYDSFLYSVRTTCPELFKNGKAVFDVFDEKKAVSFSLVQMCSFIAKFAMAKKEEDKKQAFNKSSLLNIKNKKMVIPFLVNDVLLTEAAGKIPITFSLRYPSIQKLNEKGFVSI